MKYSTVFVLALGAGLLAAPNASADVQLTMQDGRVTIKAKDATLRQIMTEWARVGQTKVVNVERIPGGPMTIELTNVTEEQALNTLMKPLSGYVAAPRATTNPGVSRFDRILVMPTVAAARQATTTSAGPAPQAVVQSPSPFQSSLNFPTPAAAPAVPAAPEDDDEPPAANAAPAPRAPVFTTFPQPQVVAPAGATAGQQPFVPTQQQQPPPQQAAPPPPAQPSPFPVAPTGVAVPGMIVPVPQQPGTAAPAVRRPGGQ